MVTLQNYEEYIMLYVDDELDTATVKELMEFLKLHPELEAELEAYKRVKLPATTELIYTDKNKLLKQTATIKLNRWLMYGVAAGIALLIVFAVGKWINKPTNTVIETPEVAKQTEPAKIPALPSASQIKEETPPAPVTPVAQSAPIAKVKPYKPTIIAKKPAIPVKVPAYKESTVIDPITNDPPEPEIARSTKDETQLASDPEPVIQPQVQPEEKKRAKRNLLAMLPISGEKKQGLQHLKNTVEEKVETVKAINDNIKNTSLELKLGNKELFVINF